MYFLDHKNLYLAVKNRTSEKNKDTNSKTLSIVFANLVYIAKNNQGRSRLDMCEISYLLPLV